MDYDAAVIGAGVAGAIVAHELSRYDLRVVVIEKGPDVCSGTSRANSGVVHAGFYNRPGTLKAELCVKGNRMFERVSNDLGVPYRKCGKLVVALDEPPKGNSACGDNGTCEAPLSRGSGYLNDLLSQGREVGTQGLRMVDREFIQEVEPHISGSEALYSPESAITSPFATTIASAEDASTNGVNFILGTRVIGVAPKLDGYVLKLSGGRELTARTVVNSAGISSAEVASMAGFDEHTIHPCRGEYLLLDRSIGHLISMLIYPVTAEGDSTLGVHLTPTVDGHIMIGPTMEYVEDASTATTREKIGQMLAEGKALLPAIERKHVIRMFSGIRPKIVPECSTSEYGDVDFIMKEEPEGVIHLIGIESPGLTAAPALAELVASRIVECLDARRKDKVIEYRWPYGMPITHDDRALAVSSDPASGDIFCRCRQVSRSQVEKAFGNPLGATGLNAIKFRTGAMMGRCQAGYCTSKLSEFLIGKGYGPDEIRMSAHGSELFSGNVKSAGGLE